MRNTLWTRDIWRVKCACMGYEYLVLLQLGLAAWKMASPADWKAGS